MKECDMKLKKIQGCHLKKEIKDIVSDIQKQKLLKN